MEQCLTWKPSEEGRVRFGKGYRPMESDEWVTLWYSGRTRYRRNIPWIAATGAGTYNNGSTLNPRTKRIYCPTPSPLLPRLSWSSMTNGSREESPTASSAEEGYRVLEAENYSETLDVLRLTRGRVDLVIRCRYAGVRRCGHRAPGIAQWPDQRILYMSAHPAEVLMQHGLSSLDAPFLAKPYTRGEVVAKVKEALERRRRARSDIQVTD